MTETSHAMVLAAGLGQRMRPLTDDKPKALVVLQGQTLLDRALVKCRKAGVDTLVVNTHYKGEMIVHHVRGMTDVTVSEEEDLLETGGGVANAIPLLGARAFFVVNCDSVWTDSRRPALQRMTANWRDTEMDALLLLQPADRAVGYDGAGDFSIDADGRLSRRGEDPHAPLVFMGVQLLHPRLFADTKVERFSLNRIYDRTLSDGRLFGLVHDGEWFHVGTPRDLATAERLMGPDG